MSRTLGIMVTMTTYGTWLRGDERGWIDEGRLMPPDPVLEDADRERLAHPVFLIPKEDLYDAGECLGRELIARMDLRIWALTMQTWHTHFVIAPTAHPLPDIVKLAKAAVRLGLNIKRPMWTDKYDRRFCFDEAAVWARIRYVERHNLAQGLPAQPWPFLTYPA
jgi:hypothetical protein